jgi:hypothetical protein
LPTGQEFSVAICGYSGKVRHMTLGPDPLRCILVSSISVQGKRCNAAQHCLALDCSLNKTPHEHLAHMLDMYQDESVDKATARLWDKETAVDCLVEMARRITGSIAKEPPEKSPTGSKIES